MALVAGIVQRHGHLDIALNNAARPGPYRPLADLAAAEWHKTLDLDLSGAFHCLQEQIRVKRGRAGAIVNTSSLTALRAVTPQPDYQAANAGLLALTRHAALQHARDGIRVNAVLPGPILTAMLRAGRMLANRTEAEAGALVPIGRLGAPEDVANAVVRLAPTRRPS